MHDLEADIEALHEMLRHTPLSDDAWVIVYHGHLLTVQSTKKEALAQVEHLRGQTFLLTMIGDFLHPSAIPVY